MRNWILHYEPSENDKQSDVVYRYSKKDALWLLSIIDIVSIEKIRWFRRRIIYRDGKVFKRLK